MSRSQQHPDRRDSPLALDLLTPSLLKNARLLVVCPDAQDVLGAVFDLPPGLIESNGLDSGLVLATPAVAGTEQFWYGSLSVENRTGSGTGWNAKVRSLHMTPTGDELIDDAETLTVENQREYPTRCKHGTFTTSRVHIAIGLRRPTGRDRRRRPFIHGLRFEPPNTR